MRLFARLQALLFCLMSMRAAALTDIDLHHVVRLEGQGSRTVILEAGLGDTMDVWKDVQPRIAAGCTRTLSYNRAGYVGSDPAVGPRDSATIVAELRAGRSLVSIADAPGELPGRVHDDLRVIALDVMAAIGHENVVRSREVGSDLILHVRR